MVSTRRSARSSGIGPVPPVGDPSEPASGAASPTVPRLRSRKSSPPQSPDPTREIAVLDTISVIPDDKTPKQPVGVENQGMNGKEIVVVQGSDETNEDEESLEEPPDWLPDGWIMETYCADNGSIHRYYTSPMSGYTFSSKMETLHYLFSEMDECFEESKASAKDNELHRSHAWLPGGWVIEIRAGGKKMDKMYKFYAHLLTGKRFLSKGDVLRYSSEGKVSRCDMDVLCDTSTDDNVLAHLEFNPDGLPDGWVKELIFRKCNDGIRKDPYYTDPVSGHVFRTLRSVLSYLKSGEISRHAYMPRRSVTAIYSFDMCVDLPQSMLKRLGVEGQTKQKSMKTLVLHKEPSDRTSNHSEGGTSAGVAAQSDPKGDMYETMKTTGQKGVSSDTNKRPRGRPKKNSKQTEECDMSSLKKAKHIDVKIEIDRTNEEDMPNGNTLDYTVKDRHTAIIQQVDKKLVAGNLLMEKQKDQETITASQLNEQEDDWLSKTSKTVTCSTVHKFYMRRGTNQALVLKKG